MQVGKLVFHSEFGKGLVIRVSARRDASRSIVTVNFKSLGTQTVPAGSLTIVN
jgi:hypothetical protein